MNSDQQHASARLNTKMVTATGFLKALVFSTVLSSSFALAQVDNIQIRYAGAANGGWSGNGSDIPGAQDGSCANMGAVGKENQAYAFGFTLPGDATITAMSAEIFATTNDAPNQPIGVQLATGANTDPATGLVGTQQQVIVPQTGADCASATDISFPADGLGGDLTDWGIGGSWPSVAQVNAAGFGLVFTKLQASSIKVDSVCLEIFYTTPEGPGVQEDCFVSTANLTLVKNVINNDGGDAADTDWTLNAVGPTPGISGVEGSAAVTSVDVEPGTYTLTETGGPSGYLFSNLSCNGGSLNVIELTLEAGQVVTCTFENNDVAPTITLNKNVINNNGGNAGANDFGLTVGGVGVNSGQAVPVDANTPIALNEAGLTGYNFVSITGDAGCPGALGGTVTLNEGENISCTINNDDIAPTITLNKNVINDNGGNAGANDFGLTVGGVGVTSGQVVPVDANTPIALNEAGLSGYNFVSITGDAGCPGALGGTVTLDEGASISCTINNDDIAPTITLVKNVINDNGGTAGVNDFGLTIGGVATTSGASVPVMSNQDYALNEAGLAGYSFVSITGAGCPGALGGTVNLNEGESITCTINNDDDAAGLTVTKTIQSDNGGTATLDDFDVQVDAVEVAWSNPASTTFGSEFITDQAGDYVLSETTVDGYTNGTWSCGGAPLTNAGLFSGATVTVGLGQSVTCSITNQDDETALIVSKVIESDNGGTATLDNFDVSVDDVEVSWTTPTATDTGMETVATEAGTYSLSEIDFAGYTEGTWSCSDSEGPVAVTNSGAFDGADVIVALGQTVTCSITNTDDPATLNLVKAVTTDNGGGAVASDWNVAADGPDDNDFNGAGSASSTSLDIGAYNLSESGGPSGYTASAWVCTGDGTQNDDDTITLGLGDVATCTITNDDIAPQLTVIKTVVNDNGGTATANQWTMNVFASNPSQSSFPGAEDPGTTITIDVGAYSVSESGGPSGYSQSYSPSCSSTLLEGQSATCTITNDDIQPLLTVTKVVINDDSGSAEVSDFELYVNGDQVVSGVQNGFNAGNYTVSEIENQDYTASISGDCAADGSITLAPGDVKSCTITNNDIEPAIPVPANNLWALLMLVLTVLAVGWYFRPEQITVR